MPVVMAVGGDPVAMGLSTRMSRPTGNVTGFTLSSASLAAKRLEMLSEIVPGLRRIAYVTPDSPMSGSFRGQVQSAAEKLGIKTIVSLRAFHSDKDELESTTLHTERIYFKTWHPEDEDIVRFLKIVSNTNAGPFLVHCQHGSDRTGTMIAVYGGPDTLDLYTVATGKRVSIPNPKEIGNSPGGIHSAFPPDNKLVALSPACVTYHPTQHVH